MSLQNGQNEPERAASSPARSPASDKSWHGKDAQARLATPGRSAVVSFGDVADDEPIGPPIGGVCRRFPPIDVVREETRPFRAQSSAGHAAAAEELVERHCGSVTPPKLTLMPFASPNAPYGKTPVACARSGGTNNLTPKSSQLAPVCGPAAGLRSLLIVKPSNG